MNSSDEGKMQTKYDELRFLKAVIQAIADPVSIVDTEGRFLFINKAYTEILGARKEDLIGKPIELSIPEGDESVHYKVQRTGRSFRGIRKQIGTNKKFVSVDASPIVINGELVGSVAMIHEFSSLKTVINELEKAKAEIVKVQGTAAKYSFSDIIGSSQALLGAVASAKKVAKTDLTVLIRGESGSGKELFAQAIHNASERANKKFIGVNCTTLTESLLDSLLFGYSSGAFTDAKKGGQIGIFEDANYGTVFLDEIGEISTSLQCKLLRVIQEREICRVGETKPRSVDVRIIAATNADLEHLMDIKMFREDLYYRLNVFPVKLPPLRERKDDIEALAAMFLKKYCAQYNLNEISMTQGAIDALTEYNWPGNVRELENVMFRSAVHMGGQTQPMLRQQVRFLKHTKEDFESDPKILDQEIKEYRDAFDEWEGEYLKAIYEKMGRNKTKTAKAMGLSVRSVYEKLKRHGI